MLTAPTVERLRALRLAAMADAYAAQQHDATLASLGFDERLAMLVDAEHLFRANRALARRLKEAKLRISDASLEALDYAAHRDLDRATIRRLATGQWIAEHHNILITGKTGVGKTFLACALAQQACRQGYRTIYRRVPRLFEELALAHADGTYTTILARFARVDVLVLDDFALVPLKEAQRQDVLELLEDRDGTRSTIIASQLPRDAWHAYLGDPTLADAILDRVVHRAYPLALGGPSRRNPKLAASGQTRSEASR
jgi:DNA replication protein DnaC